MILQRQARSVLPQSPVIDYSNPLSNGLLYCVCPALATAGGMLDCASTRYSYIATNGAFIKAGPFGKSLSCDGTNDYYLGQSDSTTDNLNSLSQMSVFVLFRFNVLSNLAIISYRGTVGGTFSPYTFNLESGSVSSSTLIHAIGGTAGASAYGLSNSVLVAGKWLQAMTVFDGTKSTNATRLRAWYDGVETSFASFNGTIPTDTGVVSSVPVQLGGSNGRYSNCDIALMMIWNRAIPDVLIKSLRVRPFQIFSPRQSGTRFGDVLSSRFSYSDMMTGGFV